MHIEQLMGHWSKANPSYWFPCRDWRAVITVITYGLPEYERQGWIQTHEFIVWPLQLLVGQNFHNFHTLSTQCERKETEKLKAEMLNRFWVTLGWSWSRTDANKLLCWSRVNTWLTSEGQGSREFFWCGWERSLCDWMTLINHVSFFSVFHCMCLYIHGSVRRHPRTHELAQLLNVKLPVTSCTSSTSPIPLNKNKYTCMWQMCEQLSQV